jgi:hypothetical protein
MRLVDLFRRPNFRPSPASVFDVVVSSGGAALAIGVGNSARLFGPDRDVTVSGETEWSHCLGMRAG